MSKYLVRIHSWDNPCLCSGELELSKGDKVVVSGEFGKDLGIIEMVDVSSREKGKEILRKATLKDLEITRLNNKNKKEVIDICRKEAQRMGIILKIVGAQFSLDGGSIVIAFTADGRIDFRQLVKNLSGIFHRSIRMQQIGSRDEARNLGGCGVCGRELCCVKFPGSIPAISTEMARIQQVVHRGSERISGICGRLMCCLSYEAEQYREMLKGMPELHSIIKTKEGAGEVIEVNAIKQEVRVRLEDKSVVTIKKEDL